MRKWLIGLATILAVLAAGPAGAQTGAAVYTLYLTAADSGTTTAASGTSNAVVEGQGHERSAGGTLLPGLDKYNLGTCVLQVKYINAADAHIATSNDGNSGTTFTVRYRESAVSGTTYIEKAAATDIITGMALSGNTLQQVEFYPVGMGNIQFQVISGITPLGRAEIEVRFLK